MIELSLKAAREKAAIEPCFMVRYPDCGCLSQSGAARSPTNPKPDCSLHPLQHEPAYRYNVIGLCATFSDSVDLLTKRDYQEMIARH